ncbi:MAG: PAS domain-containing protein [Alphaproteobacteria bacterium]|nr:PAS domain-containing protein [Alphaproteobacteria bacterium]
MIDTSLMQAFFDSADTVIYIKDAEGRFLFVNRKGAEMLDMSAADCVGQTAYDLIPRDQADRVTQIDRRVAESGTPTNFKDAVNLPTGRRVLLDHKFPVSVADHPGAVAGIAIDVTDAD